MTTLKLVDEHRRPRCKPHRPISESIARPLARAEPRVRFSGDPCGKQVEQVANRSDGVHAGAVSRLELMSYGTMLRHGAPTGVGTSVAFIQACVQSDSLPPTGRSIRSSRAR